MGIEEAALHVVRAHPGISGREIAMRVGAPPSTVNRALRRLLAVQVLERRHGPGRSRRYFEPGSRLAMPLDPEPQRLVAWFEGKGWIRQLDALQATAAWGWSRSTTQHRLKRLVESGALESRGGVGRHEYRLGRH